jgi:hypothetical protein
MSLWSWVLVGLCAAGALLALGSVAPVLRLALRLKNRVNDMQHARLFTALESLKLQNARLENLSEQLPPLSKRAQEAIDELRSSTSSATYAEMTNALQSTGEEIKVLLEALR